MNRFWKYVLLFGFFLISFLGRSEKAQAQDMDYKAYTLFLYNFMKYVEWPNTEGDFIIGVIGESPVKKELYELAKNKKAKGRQIVVLNIATANDALLCSMIYIPTSKSSELKVLSEKVKGKSVLIVAEREGLAKKGAGISFVIDEDDALKFDINKSVLDAHSLKVAAMLIRLAVIVG
ncbi:MAG: YfiR family protein [Bacteroidetes bacterium]|nr:MAG: YfiR family protein [Bacteroidota bacterium]